MTARPAVGVALVEALVVEGRRLLAEVVESEATAYERRVAMGKFLIGARAQLPRRGTAEEGWGAFLEAIAIDDMTATRYMKLAEHAATLNLTERDKPPTYADAGIDNRHRGSGAYISPEQDEGDAGYRADRLIIDDPDKPDNVIPLELESPEDERPNSPRNSWCTSKPWAVAIGPVDRDPCSNDRSHILARVTYQLERGQDGLALVNDAPVDSLDFVNCPYARGFVIRWVEKYGPRRHIFLLKFDPSTEWFSLLLSFTGTVMIPKERMEFESAPGVVESSNQFPHALFYAREADVTDAVRAKCFPPWRIK